MRFDEGRVESTIWDTAKPVVWTLIALLGAVLVAALSLPGDVHRSLFDHVQRSDLFHPEWLIAGTLLVFPVFYAARASRVAGLLVIVLPAAEMLYVADTAVETLAHFGLARGIDNLWYVLAVAQVLLFVTAAAVGVYRGVVERRWIGYLAELTSDRSSDLPRKHLD